MWEILALHYCLPKNRSFPGLGTSFTDNKNRLANPQTYPAVKMRHEGRKDISKAKAVRKREEHTS